MDTRMTDRARVLVLCSCLAVGAGCGDNLARPQADETQDPTLVTIESGEVQGSIIGSSRQFLGIPYAKPPTGELRWKAPQKPDPWSDVRAATDFGKRCAQLANPTLQNLASNDEDCLYLNIWTPLSTPNTGLPVMVWIHGGGNVNGSTSEPVPFLNSGLFYTGEFLAENHGVVVVSMNYRLGVFGFFEHPDLVAEGSSGNQGLLDQQMAMHWVRDNIAKFGGDPGNVTIFGESAGSFDVCMHVAAPTSRGLFHRAISESGGCTTKQPTKAVAQVAGTGFATAVGCTGTAALACLRGKSATELMMSPAVAAGMGFGPDVDGQFMPDQPRALYDAGQVAKVPYLLGSNTDEGTLFLGNVKVTNETEYMAALTAMFGASAGAVALKYPMASFADAPPNAAEAALARVIGDSRLVCTTFDSAQRMAKGGTPVYMYNFDIPVPSSVLPPGVYLGASHGSELTSVFGTSPLFALDPPGKAASDRIQRYWTNFARTGDPNGGTDLAWPAFTTSANVRINLALEATVVNDFRKDLCAFWQLSYGLQF
jgi:para-nitrobenzyl esterase